MNGAIHILPIQLHDVARDFAYCCYYYYYYYYITFMQGIYYYIPETMFLGYAVLQLLCICHLCFIMCIIIIIIIIIKRITSSLLTRSAFRG